MRSSPLHQIPHPILPAVHSPLPAKEGLNRVDQDRAASVADEGRHHRVAGGWSGGAGSPCGRLVAIEKEQALMKAKWMLMNSNRPETSVSPGKPRILPRTPADQPVERPDILPGKPADGPDDKDSGPGHTRSGDRDSVGL
jgi:hypothetical protein